MQSSYGGLNVAQSFYLDRVRLELRLKQIASRNCGETPKIILFRPTLSCRHTGQGREKHTGRLQHTPDFSNRQVQVIGILPPPHADDPVIAFGVEAPGRIEARPGAAKSEHPTDEVLLMSLNPMIRVPA